MYTTINETGQLNNYATESEMYLASYPAPEQQQRYLLQGSLATLLISALTLTALVVS
ncbi:MAG: photosystem II assembly protein Psb34 [Leptolyngbyaceae cyanobacterium]